MLSGLRLSSGLLQTGVQVFSVCISSCLCSQCSLFLYERHKRAPPLLSASPSPTVPPPSSCVAQLCNLIKMLFSTLELTSFVTGHTLVSGCQHSSTTGPQHTCPAAHEPNSLKLKMPAAALNVNY